MKKVISIICLILVFFIIYFLQINFFSWFNIAEVKPNLFVILVLFIGLFCNKKVAAVFGFFIGIYLDILTSKQVGISSITFAFLGYFGGFLDKSFSKESKITIILMVLGSTFAYEIIVYIYSTISNNVPFDILGFNRIMLIELVFNVLLTIILYPIIKNCGNILERIFKSKNTATLFLN